MLETVFHKTFDKYEKFIDNLENVRPAVETNTELAEIEGKYIICMLQSGENINNKFV